MKIELPTIVGTPQLNQLSRIIKHTSSLKGEVWECGVYLGRSALILAAELNGRTLRLFDTFSTGIPETGKNDTHVIGDFSISKKDYNNIVETFSNYPSVYMHKGMIPETFTGLEDSKISLAHIDVDQEQTYRHCIDFIWPRLVSGGYMVFDDYDAPSCPGANLAVNEFCEKYNLNILADYPDQNGVYIIKL